MPDGTLCERMDRKKCPFHGKIIPRDSSGKPALGYEEPKISPKKPPLLNANLKKKSKKTKPPPTTKQRLAGKLFKKRR